MTTDKIKHHIGETIYNHIGSLTEPQLKTMLASLEQEINREQQGTPRAFKLSVEKKAILNRLS